MSATEDRIDAIRAMLGDISDKLDRLPLASQVDLGAYLKSISQQATQMIDGVYTGQELVKPGLRQILKPQGKTTAKGIVVPGGAFQAAYLTTTSMIFDQAAFRAAHPGLAKKFLRESVSERLFFQPRSR